MGKSSSFIKKTLKTIVWMVLVFVLLFLVVAGIIQIPVVQTRIVHYVTTFISNKTHTKVEIKNVSISFPKAVVLQGLYLEDKQSDTLIYAGDAKINIALKDLLFNKIFINNIELNRLHLNLYNTETDSLFNYNFLIKAFTDTTTSTQADTTATTWNLAIDNLILKNVHFRYKDAFGGMNVTATLEKSELSMDEINLEKSLFRIDDLLVEKLRTTITINKTSASNNESSNFKQPIITANNIQINNSTIVYDDQPGNQSVVSFIKRFELKKGRLDVCNQTVELNKIYLSKSEISYNTSETESSNDSIISATESTVNNWKVSIKNIDFADNAVQYTLNNSPKLLNAFDVNNLIFNNLYLIAHDFNYAWDKTAFIVDEFSATDQNNFVISHFETEFNMDNQSITAKDLKIKTNTSTINGDVNLQFFTLSSLMDSLPQLTLNLKLKKSSLSNTDILYFSPELEKQDFFKNKKTISSFSGNISGKINNLKGKNIVFKTGLKTSLKTDFHIIGLPTAGTSFFDFPNLNVISCKKDIQQIGNSYLPLSIDLPDEIRMNIAFKGKSKAFTTSIDLYSNIGNGRISASIDTHENFDAALNITDFDLGILLKNKEMYGPVSLTANVKGYGLDQKTVKAKINAYITKLKLNHYTYHNLTLNGNVANQQFDGKINLNDENAIFDFTGVVNFNKGQERFKFHLNLVGADLQKLNFTKQDMRIAFNATADLTGGTVSKLNGKAGITTIVIAQNGKKYLLDSLLVISVNQPNKSEMNFNSALINMKYIGTISPTDLPATLSNFMDNYFPFTTTKPIITSTNASDFKFEIQIKNHPVLSEVLIPQLNEFEPGKITGSFDNRKKELKLFANMKRIVYGTTEINDVLLDISADSTAMNYKISSSKIANSLVKFDNFLFDGKIAEDKITANISSVDLLRKKLFISSVITKQKSNYRLALHPKEFYLMNNRWNIAEDNFIEFGKSGILFHNLFLQHAASEVTIRSVNDKFNDDINIFIKNFKLEDISNIVEKDSSLVKGNLDGNILLKPINNSYGIVTDASVTNLFVRNVPIGNLTVKASNRTSDRFDIGLQLTGNDNNLTSNGYFIPNGGNNSMSINTDIQSLSMKTIEAFSLGQITQASGVLTGNFLITGNTSAPKINGEIVFNNAFMNPKYLNNRIELKHETIQLKTDGFYFKSFTLYDAKQQKAVIDGSVMMNQFSDFRTNLHVNSTNFLLFNTTAANNKEFYGRMIVDSKINIVGPMTLPVINATVKLKERSNFTFVVPEDKYTTGKGENVIVFENTEKFNSLLNNKLRETTQNSGITGFDLYSIIEVDKKATLRLLMDPTSSDSLVVKGEAALSFTMDRSGKMSLSGAYNLNEGSYLVSLESIIKRKFDIISGSSITWNGDPFDADIAIDASYAVRTAPFNLIADQLSGLSNTEKGIYKQAYPFLVLLKLRGNILQPEISFEIQLPPEDKGIMGGAINQKLILLNDDPSALNKQVFALLVLGRFVQENPLQSESVGAIALLRSTVGNFLSAQLNKLSSKVIPGMEMNFDVQSYDDYQTGKAQGRTQVEIGLKKQLFNERLTVEIGGTVDVEGENAKQNSASSITSDVDVEYKLTNDGSFRLKGFRHNQYEGALEGQLIETGVGIVYVRDFNRWSELFPKPETKKKIKNKQRK